MGCVLRCVECPPVGGDTMWANMALAYEKLPDHVKAQIDGLRARHSIEATFGAVMPIEKRLAFKAQFPDPEHPVVRTHPERSEEHTSELQSLMRHSYAVLCLKKKKTNTMKETTSK